MTMRFMWNNLADSASVITASTEETGYPVENVQDYRIAKKWRTTGVGATETITIDMGAATAVTCAIIAGHDFDNTETNIQFRRSTDNFAANDVLVATFTYSAFTMVEWFSSVSFRYYRWTFTKANAADVRNIGRVFTGTYFEPSLSQQAGWERENFDPSIVQRALSGAVFGDQRDKFFLSRWTINGLTASDIATYRTMVAANGITIPMFVALDQANAPRELTHYGRLKDVPAENEFLSTPNYNLSFAFEEEPG